MSLIIRHERAGDIERIHGLIATAFRSAPHTLHREQFIVDALRDAGALSISLVAEEAGRLLGHVALSPVSLADGTGGWYGLGPIAVAPDAQGRGIGSQLMRAALAELRKLPANGCVLLGEPEFYRRFGFAPVAGLTLPGVPAQYFQALLLAGDYPQGAVTYHAAFAAKA